MRSSKSSTDFEILIVGAGILGLSTAYNLLRCGVKSLAIVDQNGLANSAGSSRGESRIARSIYADSKFTDLALVAFKNDWPRMQSDFGKTLLVPRSAYYFGPSKVILPSYSTTLSRFKHFQQHSPNAGEHHLPQLRKLPSDYTILEDESASIIRARTTLESLRDYITEKDSVHIERANVNAITQDRNQFIIETQKAQISTKHVILATGPWTRKICPEYQHQLLVIPQTVVFFDASSFPESSSSWPAWVHIERLGENPRIHYSIPPFAGEPLKLAYEEQSPSEAIEAPNDECLLRQDNLVSYANSILRPDVDWNLTKSELCYYTLAKERHIKLDWISGQARGIVISAGSGHAFKFGPLLGRIASNLILHGNSGVPEFDKLQNAFAFNSSTA